MTWKEFKEMMDHAGVNDETEIDYMDFSGLDSPNIEVEKAHNAVTVWS